MTEHTDMPIVKRSKKKKKKAFPVVIIIIAAVLLIAATGYAAASGLLGETVAGAVKNLKEWVGIEQALTPPADNGNKEPVDEPTKPVEPSEDPVKDPEDPVKDPEDPVVSPQEPDDNPDNTPGSPVIYVGQVLIIPVSGGGSPVSTVISSGTLPSNEKRIALTFDSGWETKQTIPMLDILDRYGVRATFFPRALWVKDNPEPAREIVRRGHTMGNHSLTHPHMNKMTAQQMRHEMRESTRIIEEVTGVRPYLFRPPYGEYNRLLLQILAEEGYPYTVMWTVDTHDWANTMHGQTINVDYVVNRVLNNAGNNGIVLMHVMDRSVTVEALPLIITGLRNKGYSFATVDEMLPAPGNSPITHAVKSGETLYSIAKQYGVTVQQIIDSNNL